LTLDVTEPSEDPLELAPGRRCGAPTSTQSTTSLISSGYISAGYRPAKTSAKTKGGRMRRNPAKALVAFDILELAFLGEGNAGLVA
jgi:hypothetical protein